ncbi:unnamed protein product (macronuclear) [Paramecium tetraurelia]|uniref:Uncharacterized protein n=1 Tax=Paramecium tetraurelia TaxID=5888 RepID=A0BSC7_PARTE|nr:uncharacterized protein GSPATT00031675001 [Paramecium tetraurelia]CAK61444.1 unnamed protein product [Paramecium tetraurelia]|eukprot:XP_001428842.1 hypothetical protein (macronuclear) [Paramecium tetraurelia strain d4-2]
MRIFLIFFILCIFALDVNGTFCLDNITSKAILRRNYKNVIQLYNGAMQITARTNMFIVPIIDNSPIRDLIYFPYNGVVGHVAVPLHGTIIIEFLQSYLINKIRFWMYDYDSRITHMQVFAIGDDRMTETLIYEGSAPPGVMAVKFSQLSVSKLRFYNKDGNTLYEHMSLLKIQAYYAF